MAARQKNVYMFLANLTSIKGEVWMYNVLSTFDSYWIGYRSKYYRISIIVISGHRQFGLQKCFSYFNSEHPTSFSNSLKVWLRRWVMDIEMRLWAGHGSKCSRGARKALLSAVVFRELNMRVTTPDWIVSAWQPSPSWSSVCWIR